MRQARYDVESRDRGQIWAIVRTGPTGGIKFITAYDNEPVAQAMATQLNRNAHKEI
jgi:hypothetical protein